MQKIFIQDGNYTYYIWQLLEDLPFRYEEKLKGDKYKEVDQFAYYTSMIPNEMLNNCIA